MSISLINYKDLALKVVYFTKKRQLGSKIFFATSKFQEVLEYFEKNLKDSQTFLKSCYFLNGKQIYPSDILLYFCIVDPSLRLVEEDMFLEIEELENLDDASEPINEKLMKPLINPFSLIILNTKEGIMQQADFPKEKIEEYGLDSLNENYACCNSNDALYISCGKSFWIISYNNYLIEKKEMPFFKEKHSMAYILSNNTIFIAGGSEESFYYDINSKEFITWGKMAGIKERPALIQFGDFLYSFNSFNEKGIYFEKTKLTNPAKVWEKFLPQSGDKESGFFYNKEYGVTKCSGGNVLFAGGENNQLRTFLYNLKMNVLYINASKDESIILNERNFYKIDHNFSIAIPKNIEKDQIIAIVNKNSKALNLVPFKQIGVQTRNNLLKLDDPRNRIPGNIIIKCRYMSLKDYENFMKQKDMQENNPKTKGGFDIYNRKEKQGQKIGEKKDLSDPYKYQYRGNVPALERISEGKSEEENDEDDYVKHKSSSAKKENRILDLGLKLENIGKFNFSTQKREEKKIDDKNKDNEGNKSNQKNNEKNDNENQKNILNKNSNTDNMNQKNISINKNEVTTNINNKNNDEKKKEMQSQGNQEKVKANLVINKSRDKKKKIIKEVKHKKINLYLDKKEEGKEKELPSQKNTSNNNLNKNENNTNINNKKLLNDITNKPNNFTKPNTNDINNTNSSNNPTSVKNNKAEQKINPFDYNINNSQNNLSYNNVYNPFIPNNIVQNSIEKEPESKPTEKIQNSTPIPNNANQIQDKDLFIKDKKSQKKTNYKPNSLKSVPINNQEISNISHNKRSNTNSITKANSYKASTYKLSKDKKSISKSNNQNNKINIINKINKQIKDSNTNNGEIYTKIKKKDIPNQRLNTTNIDTKIINKIGNNISNISNQYDLSSDKIIKGNNNKSNMGMEDIKIIVKGGKKYILKKVSKQKKEDKDIENKDGNQNTSEVNNK